MLDGKERSTKVPPIGEEANEFWFKLWDNPVPCKEDAEWLKDVELELENVNIQESVDITKEDVIMQFRTMPNWKAPGWTEFRGFGSRGLLVNIRG